MTRPSKTRIRSTVGLILLFALLPVLLGVMACLPTPIGDPEQARVDEKMAGVWFIRKDGEPAILILEPFDKRCYLATWMGVEWKAAPKEGEEPEWPALEDLDGGKVKARGIIVAKAWLTSIGGKPFMCWEPQLQLDAERGMRPEFWFGWKVHLDGRDRLTMMLVNPDHKAFEGLEQEAVTREQVEAVIAKHEGDPELYDDTFAYKRIPRSGYGTIKGLLEESGFE